MPQSSSLNRRIVLASRPRGEPADSDFRLETGAVPEPGPGQLLLRTVYLSLDPYMRGRMSDAPSYAEPVQVGQPMVGGTVARVAASRHADYPVGEWVLSQSGWQDYAVSDGSGLLKLGPAPERPSYSLGVLGMPGFTGYMGLLDIGQPKAGETVVVAAASGAVGAVVGQLAKIHGCKAVGIAGGPDKCRYVVEELGFDACIDHKDPAMANLLAKAVPQGIDVYFENVGGAVFDAVLPLLNPRARVPVCGLISAYNATSLPDGPDRLPLLMRTILTKRIKMQGFIIFNEYAPRFGEFRAAMQELLRDGRIKYREDVVDGLENAPRGLMGLLKGENAGKRIVRVGPDE
ncbi:NADP-dependent oxidoreductase [Achromobacter xylosoxidans]|uniref:NADP-dependent oxidoreductase n=1 Tax=Achromobacter TaxID=222 RepID=UPI0006C2549D|nr:NADP-dependent oxidoreductase [Achromobacter xylosoxidans]PNM88434.1 NADP-dependent oxidoreductase [Achromobacter xylosoxidans]CUI44643.1 NADPH-dependent curcumin reductase [Achromobacter xylosoxidans]